MGGFSLKFFRSVYDGFNGIILLLLVRRRNEHIGPGTVLCYILSYNAPGAAALWQFQQYRRGAVEGTRYGEQRQCIHARLPKWAARYKTCCSFVRRSQVSQEVQDEVIMLSKQSVLLFLVPAGIEPSTPLNRIPESRIRRCSLCVVRSYFTGTAFQCGAFRRTG